MRPHCVQTVSTLTCNVSAELVIERSYKLMVHPLTPASDKYSYIKLVIYLLSNAVVRTPGVGLPTMGRTLVIRDKKVPTLGVYTPGVAAGTGWRLGFFLDLTMLCIWVVSPEGSIVFV